MNTKTPVTIITGFLGAGKTTFLNKLIADNRDKKFAIIENEYGETGIDQELVINHEDGIFEMANGCICCSLNTELAQLLLKLQNGDFQFDHLLIETTGIAEPDAIAGHFLSSAKNSFFELDATICLTDAKDIISNLEERGEAIKQVSFSDVILLNKADLVSGAQLLVNKNMLRNYNADAKIISGEYGNFNNQDLLSIKAYDGKMLESQMTKVHHHGHQHSDLIAHSFEFAEPINASKFEHWVNTLLLLSGSQIYRIKGILNISDVNEKYIFQSVRSRSKLEEGSAWKAEENRSTKIVFIGYNIRKDILQKGLEGCLKA